MKSFNQVREEMSALERDREKAQQANANKLAQEKERKDAMMQDTIRKKEEMDAEKDEEDREDRIVDRVYKRITGK